MIIKLSFSKGGNDINSSINVKEKYFKELEDYISKLPEKKGALITTLHKAQEIIGYLPQEVQEFIAERLKLPVSKVYGVVQFYSFFTMVPRGENCISVCMGTACYVRGSEKVLDQFQKQLGIKSGETTPDGKFSLDALRCVGACGLAPVVVVGEKVYGKITPSKVAEILAEYK